MGYICYRDETKNGCKGCEYYRFDEDEGRKACFAATDENEVLRNTIREIEFLHSRKGE